MSSLVPSRWSASACSLSFALALSTALGACASLTEPGNGAPPAQAEPAAEPKAPEPPAAPAAAPPPAEERVGASHVLIQYKGSMRASPEVKRSKDEAKKLATEVMGKAKKGQ